ncbi:hypothetical protein R1flu_010551 [Riccia fluitans]|uniref:Uncharacterized protein n=1 Tax=Riccia fluitans TaxID=41844 RepID=A0ABD1Z7S3_9MARC
MELSPKDEKKLGFVRDEDEVEDVGPSSPKADKVRAVAEEETAAETLTKTAEEEEEADTVNLAPNKEDPNAKAEPE